MWTQQKPQKTKRRQYGDTSYYQNRPNFQPRYRFDLHEDNYALSVQLRHQQQLLYVQIPAANTQASGLQTQTTFYEEIHKFKVELREARVVQNNTVNM